MLRRILWVSNTGDEEHCVGGPGLVTRVRGTKSW